MKNLKWIIGLLLILTVIVHQSCEVETDNLTEQISAVDTNLEKAPNSCSATSVAGSSCEVTCPAGLIPHCKGKILKAICDCLDAQGNVIFSSGDTGLEPGAIELGYTLVASLEEFPSGISDIAASTLESMLEAVLTENEEAFDFHQQMMMVALEELPTGEKLAFNEVITNNGGTPYGFHKIKITVDWGRKKKDCTGFGICKFEIDFDLDDLDDILQGVLTQEISSEGNNLVITFENGVPQEAEMAGGILTIDEDQLIEGGPAAYLGVWSFTIPAGTYAIDPQIGDSGGIIIPIQ